MPNNFGESHMKSFFIASQNTVEWHVGAKFQVDWSRNNFMKMPYPIIYYGYFLIRFPQTKITLFIFFNNWVNKGKKKFSASRAAFSCNMSIPY